MRSRTRIALLVKRRRPARRMDLVVWLVVVLLATHLGLSGLMREASSRPFLVGFMLMVWLVAGIASAMTWRELLGIGRAPASLVALLAGPQTAFPNGRGVTWDEITGGSSNLIMVAEACGREIVWTEPRDVDVGREALTVNAPGDRSGRSAGILSAYHPGGVQVAMADGSVQFLTQSIDPQVLRSLMRAREEIGASGK